MSFELQPTLVGSTLRIRPLREEDREALYSVARDPLIWEQHPVKTRHTPEGFAIFFEESLASGGCLVVEEKESGRVIGSSRYYEYNEANSEIEVGWTYLERAHWGGKTNRELKALMLEHAFRFVKRVLLKIGPENRRSRRAAEKIGAVLEREDVDGGGRPCLVYVVWKG